MTHPYRERLTREEQILRKSILSKVLIGSLVIIIGFSLLVMKFYHPTPPEVLTPPQCLEKAKMVWAREPIPGVKIGTDGEIMVISGIQCDHPKHRITVSEPLYGPAFMVTCRCSE
jgi:hypothetical protein